MDLITTTSNYFLNEMSRLFLILIMKNLGMSSSTFYTGETRR